MAKDIDVKIAPDGQIEVKVAGHPGPGCRELTRQLRAALGRTEADRTTPEFGLEQRSKRRTETRT